MFNVMFYHLNIELKYMDFSFIFTFMQVALLIIKLFIAIKPRLFDIYIKINLKT